MSDGPALLRAVIDNPSEDTPRLVFADWLDEHDEEDRAEFIRAQVRLAGMKPWDDGYTALDVRCRHLRRAHPEWFDVAEDFVFRMERFCGRQEESVDRGFLTRVKLKPNEFV